MNPLKVTKERSAQIDLNSAADKATFTFPFNARLIRAGLVIADASTAAATVAVDKRVLAGSDTGRTEIDTIVKAASDVQGQYLYVDLTGNEVACGDQIVFETTVDPAEEVLCVAVLEYEEIAETVANYDEATESA